MVQTNIKLGYISESKNDKDYISDGLRRPFVVLSIARCPHFEIFSGNKSAWFEFPVPCYIHTLYIYSGENEYQTSFLTRKVNMIEIISFVALVGPL